ncbi:MAG: hypothetical protein U1E91_04150 [Moraxella sp.]
MYLSALSVMSLLNLEQPKEIFVYIAYNVDKINNPNLNPNNPAAAKQCQARQKEPFGTMK